MPPLNTSRLVAAPATKVAESIQRMEWRAFAGQIALTSSVPKERKPF